MEICFENKELLQYRLSFTQKKTARESMEAVIPEANGDISRIVTADTSICLKAKEISGTTVNVSGEVSAVVIYVSENELKLESFKLTKSFSMCFETENSESEALSQVSLELISCEAGTVNPRKLALSFEVSAVLRCYRDEKAFAGNFAAQEGELLHTFVSEADCMTLQSVCEKSFSINEQLAVEASAKLISASCRCETDEVQIVGTKLIVKGRAHIFCLTQDATTGAIQTAESERPFSQVVETGQDGLSAGMGEALVTAEYYELIDTISGTRALDCEIHALLQLRAYAAKRIEFVTDAYSNRMKYLCGFETASFLTDTAPQLYSGRIVEAIAVPEDCAELMNVFISGKSFSFDAGTVKTELIMDILYKVPTGELAVIRRRLETAAETTFEKAPDMLCIQNASFRLISGSIEAQAELVFSGITERQREAVYVSSVTLDESTELTEAASFTLVRSEGRSLWALAKEYHSSVEAIESFNAGEKSGSKLLLVPKTL